MTVRRRSLSAGWYPEKPGEIREWIEDWVAADVTVEKKTAVAGVVPHAGWYFSGDLAFQVMRRLSSDVETVVVVGGHLSSDARCMVAGEDEYETPLGNLTADLSLLRQIEDRIECISDTIGDNTVEVQLPLIRALFPRIQVLAMRAPASSISVALGRSIAEAAEHAGKRVAVIGSTDLTHYGPQYGFTPAGMGEKAIRWVREENDAGMIDRLIRMDGQSAIHYATQAHSACSIGGAVAAMEFARTRGVSAGCLLGYHTSLDRGPSSSFVGYSAIIYQPPGPSVQALP